MSQNLVQKAVEELRRHLAALEDLARLEPRRGRELLPAAFEELRRSIQDLEGFRETDPGPGPEPTTGDRRLDLQHSIARILSEVSTLAEASTPILRALCEKLGWDLGQLWTVDKESDLLRCIDSWSPGHVPVSAFQQTSRDRVFAIGAGLPGRVWKSGQPAWIPDVVVDPNFPRAKAAARVGLHCGAAFPVSLRGETYAVLELFGSRIRETDQQLFEAMAAVGAQLSQFMERMAGEERNRVSEARKAAILEASLDALITIDHQGHVVEFNSAAQRTFGYSREAVLGHRMVDLIVPHRLRERQVQGFEHCLANGDGPVLGKRLEMSALRADGMEFPVELTIVRVPVEGPPLFTGYVRDITERKAAEKDVAVYQEGLQRMASDLLLAEERERRRLAVDLHDGLSQTVALAQMKLAAVREAVEPGLRRTLEDIENLIAQANEAARSITFQLSPPILHDLGLGPALQWLAEDFHARYGLFVAFDHDGRPEPHDASTRVILFRSVRELLINAAKHAGAGEVRLSLRVREGLVCVEVKDDGSGMEPGGATQRGSGLFSIRERMAHIGGNMRLDSARGRGTTVHLTAPIVAMAPNSAEGPTR